MQTYPALWAAIQKLTPHNWAALLPIQRAQGASTQARS
jgi:hypothetical protein